LFKWNTDWTRILENEELKKGKVSHLIYM